MDFSIRTRNVKSPDQVMAHVERRASFALSRFLGNVKAVDILIEDINGPRGGVDQRCRYIVTLNRFAQPLIADVTTGDLVSAIDIASDKIGFVVSRAVDRGDDRKRRRISRHLVG